jgi:hypothetical protein
MTWAARSVPWPARASALVDPKVIDVYDKLRDRAQRRSLQSLSALKVRLAVVGDGRSMAMAMVERGGARERRTLGLTDQGTGPA